MKNARNSGFELMRIISMFLIVLFHTIHHGNVLNLAVNPYSKIILQILELITLVHVNSFVLVTGFFQCKSKFKLSKTVDLILMCTFYKIIIMIIFSVNNLINLSFLDIIKELFPIDLINYWFFKYYIILYLLSPFINKMINNLSKSDYKKLVFIMLFVFSLLPMVTNGMALENNGFTLYQFVFMYIVGAYFKCYPFDIKITLSKYRIILLVIFFGSLITNYVIYLVTFKIEGIHYIIDTFVSYYRNFFVNYNNIFVVFQSISYFLLFSTLNFYNSIINHISKMMFGIYLIHDNFHVRLNIYNWLKIDGELICSFRYFVFVIIIAMLIFVSCFIIDSIRSWICYYLKKNKYIVKIYERVNGLITY